MTKILEIETEHVLPFRTLIEVLKDILADAVIECTSDTIEGTQNNDIYDDSDKKRVPGMRIVSIDSTKSILISLRLDAKEFTKFICRKPSIELGVNLVMFNKLIKSIDKDDTLTLYVDDDNMQHLNIQIDNNEKRCQTLYTLNLMDLDNRIQEIPPTRFDVNVTMSSSDFHKLCREMNHIAEHIEIKCTPRSICFTCKGDCAQRCTTYNKGDDGIQIQNVDKKTQIVQGIFELKNLVLFTKCSNLCNDIQILMKNDYPLVIRYTVATLGRILLCLTPVQLPQDGR